MSDPAPRPHPSDFVALCDAAIARLLALRDAAAPERGLHLAEIHADLGRIDARLEELDWEAPRYAYEQGALHDAANALAAIALDRGGPHVPRYVDRIVDDLRRIRTG